MFIPSNLFDYNIISSNDRDAQCPHLSHVFWHTFGRGGADVLRGGDSIFFEISEGRVIQANEMLIS